MHYCIPISLCFATISDSSSAYTVWYTPPPLQQGIVSLLQFGQVFELL